MVILMTDKLPAVDLTTAGASVDPQTLFNDPRYVPQPDMPDGEPSYHELVVMVQRLERDLQGIKAQFRTMHIEMVEYARNTDASISSLGRATGD